MGQSLIALRVSLLVAGYYFTTTGTIEPNPYGTPSDFNKVVLYSIAHDGHSQLKRIQLEKQEIDFVEQEPMKDDVVFSQLQNRLLEVDYDFDGLPLVFHLPIVEVNGELLVKPAISDIWNHLKYEGGVVPGEDRSWTWSSSKVGTGVSSRSLTPAATQIN